MRFLPIFTFASVVGACTQVLGIDENYTPFSEAPAGSGGHVVGFDAGHPHAPPPRASASGAGGAPESGGYANELPPPPRESAGGMPVLPEMDAGHHCAAGQKWCGACVPIDPSVGCATASCNPCMVADPMAHAVCDEAGVCDVVCNAGLVRNVDRCEPPMDTGGTTGAGGMGTGGAGTGGGSGGVTGSGGGGAGGRNPVCNPFACPTCSRGFEGCCIPGVPGAPSHCGCFYFPPLCTKDVG